MSIINFKFRNQVLNHNASLSYCYQCATCSSGCPVALLTNGSYNPRKIIEMSILGFKEDLIEKQNPSVWLCSTCQKCVELCPQQVELTEIFEIIKNLCFKRGKVPEAFISQAKAILERGIAIPYSNAILNRRESLGLPNIKTAPLKELTTLYKDTKLKENINRRSEK